MTLPGEGVMFEQNVAAPYYQANPPAAGVNADEGWRS